VPLTIEDGTGVSGADSFATTAEFDASQVDLFSVALPGTDAEKEASLRRGYLYMRSLNWTDAAEFPTFSGTIPADIKTAQSILARAEIGTPGALAPNVVPGQQKILTRVGEIGWTPTGQTGVDAQRSVVTLAMDLLGAYLNGTGSTKFINRA